MMLETIIAAATPQGKSGVSVIRMSGENSLEIAKQVFLHKNFNEAKQSNIEPNKMYLGKIKLDDNLQDTGFCVFFKAPLSYTGEDVIEFQCHGGLLVTEKIIKQCVNFGAKLAEPGEFSKRAFLNGKMSLDQAEGIIDTINAETENQLKASNVLTKGNLFKVVSNLQENLTDILSEIEVNLDYPEHDIEYQTKENINARLTEVLDEVKKLLSTEGTGNFIKKGISVAIVGRTNVGKSSLLNALLGYEQAIVTDIEGTTRDVVTGSIEYNGFIFNFYDTAGIRGTADPIENIGIIKARETLENSDIVLLVLDSSKELTEQDTENIALTKNKKTIVVLNKSDMPDKLGFKGKAIKVSAKQKINTEKLKEKIYNLSLETCCNVSNNVILTNARHTEILKEVKGLIINLQNNILYTPLDCVSLDVKTVWEKLGEITGLSANENIIDKIFSKFCLGK